MPTEEQREAEDQVGRPHVRLPEHRLREVHVEHPDEGDGEQDRHRRPDDDEEEPGHRPASGGDRRARRLVADALHGALDRLGGLGGPVGGLDLGPGQRPHRGPARARVRGAGVRHGRGA